MTAEVFVGGFQPRAQVHFIAQNGVIRSGVDDVFRARVADDHRPRADTGAHGDRRQLVLGKLLNFVLKLGEAFLLSARLLGRPQLLVLLLVELAALFGPPDGMPVPGMKENDYYQAFGEKYVGGEERLAEGIREYKVSKEGLGLWLAASEVVDILEDLNEALDRAGITVAESEGLDQADGLTDLLLDLPSRSVVYELRRLRHENPGTTWEPGDLDDISALGVSVAYCDIVFTERQWAHLARRGGFRDRFGTEVRSDVRELPEVLARV